MTDDVGFGKLNDAPLEIRTGKPSASATFRCGDTVEQYVNVDTLILVGPNPKVPRSGVHEYRVAMYGSEQDLVKATVALLLNLERAGLLAGALEELFGVLKASETNPSAWGGTTVRSVLYKDP